MVTETQARMDTAVRTARLYAVKPEHVMSACMLHNWRRRTKRLDRASLRAVSERRHARVAAIAKARKRLATGRLN